MSEEKTRYWLKLDKGFLKSSKIKVIKNMPNGKDYIIFYLSLMLESVETVGHLKFSEFVPYNEEMLSAITDTNVDIVRSAVKIFSELGLLRILTDGTIFMPEVPNLTGKECESAERVRKFRERKLLENNILHEKMLPGNVDVTKSNDNINKQSNKQLNKNKQIQIQTEQNEKEQQKKFFSDDDEKIDQILSLYPRREGNNAKKPIRNAIVASWLRGNTLDAMYDGTLRYVDYVAFKGIENTQYVMSGVKFFQDECFKETWEISKVKPKEQKSGQQLMAEATAKYTSEHEKDSSLLKLGGN